MYGYAYKLKMWTQCIYLRYAFFSHKNKFTETVMIKDHILYIPY